MRVGSPDHEGLFRMLVPSVRKMSALKLNAQLQAYLVALKAREV